MRAQFINEGFNFKRGLDPKQAMGTGLQYKSHLLEIMPPAQRYNSDTCDKIIEIINSDHCIVTEENYDNGIIFTLKFKKTPYNYFIFKTIQDYFTNDSHVIWRRGFDDTTLGLFYSGDHFR